MDVGRVELVAVEMRDGVSACVTSVFDEEWLSEVDMTSELRLCVAAA